VLKVPPYHSRLSDLEGFFNLGALPSVCDINKNVFSKLHKSDVWCFFFIFIVTRLVAIEIVTVCEKYQKSFSVFVDFDFNVMRAFGGKRAFETAA